MVLQKRFLAAALMMAMAAAASAQDVVREVVVTGRVRVNLDAILEVMRLKPGVVYTEDDRERDEQAVNNLGYFSAVTVRATPAEAGAYRILVDVKEYGTIKEIRLAGNTVISAEDILKVVTLKPGQLFNLGASGPSNRAIRELYDRRGSFVRILEFQPLDDSPGTLSIVLAETRVGTVSVQGAKDTRDFVFRRLIKTRPGEVYERDRWIQDLRRLNDTQFFAPGSIDSLFNQNQEADTLDLTAAVREDRTGNFQVGLQVDPRNSFAGIIKLTESNFRGSGQSIGVDFLQAARVGGPSISLDYRNPFFDNKDTTLQASIYSRLVYRFAGTFGQSTFAGANDYFERRSGGTVGISRIVRDKPLNVLSAGLSARLEGVRTNVPDSSSGAIFTNLGNTFIRQDGTVGVVTFGATLNRRDSALDASRGDFLQFNLEPGFSDITKVSGPVQDADILGRSSFVRTSLDYRRYFTNQPDRTARDIDAPRRVLALRARVGTIVGKVPFFEQFFAGGAQTVRGYNEDQFWGKTTVVTSAELRIPVQASFNVIGFLDYGGAFGGYSGFNGLEQSASFRLHLGYGLGVAVRTPLGPIRLDFGFDENGRSRTHFLIGTSF